MNWLALLMEALEDAHADHEESCDCYERLRDGLSGTYRFPEVDHRVEDQPIYGCETQQAYYTRAMMEKISAEMMRHHLAFAERFMGLSEHLRPQ